MKELTSKQILGVEMLFLIFPTTLFFILYGSVMVMWSISSWKDTQTLIGAASLLFCAVAIIAVWHSCIYFLRYGRTKLNGFSNFWKLIVYIGGVYVAVSWGVMLLFEYGKYPSENEFSMMFFFGLFGTPLLMPLLHLLLEWRASSRKRYHG